ALDGTVQENHPYTVTEQNFTIRLLQPKAGNRHAVFLTHTRESINYHYERNPADPRITHTLNMEVDEFGNILKSATVGYGRRKPDQAMTAQDRKNQTRTLVITPRTASQTTLRRKTPTTSHCPSRPAPMK